MSEIDLYAVVREVCDQSTAADPATLAKEVAQRIPKAQAQAALQQALPVVVQHVVSRHRPPMPTRQAQSQASRSAKVAGIRETWRRYLHTRVSVGEDQWKWLGECTAADLRYSAQVNEDHARRNVARAAEKRQLADLLERHGVATVAELPDDVLSESLGRAA